MPAETCRLQDGDFQTLVLEYTHEETGSVVDLIGTAHYGEQSYFDAITGIVEEREAAGALVHYEYTGRAPDEDRAASSVATRLLLGGLQSTNRFSQKVMDRLFIDGLGLVYQSDGIDYKGHETWENHDLNNLEIVQRMGGFTVFTTALLNLAGGGILRLIPRPLQVPAAKGLIKALADTPEDFLEGGKGRSTKIIVAARNDVALGAIDDHRQQEPDRSFVEIWGAGHLPGLGGGLEQRGYTRTGGNWLTALRLERESR